MNALSRFGTFTNLKITHSSAKDVYPNTETFSFYGSTYQSQYLSFDGVEMTTNEPSGSSYKTLQTPTQQQVDTWQKYTTGYPFLYLDGHVRVGERLRPRRAGEQVPRRNRGGAPRPE